MASIQHNEFNHSYGGSTTPIPCIGAGNVALTYGGPGFTEANSMVTIGVQVFLERSGGASAGFLWTVATFRYVAIPSTPIQVGPIVNLVSQLDSDVAASSIVFVASTAPDAVTVYYNQASANTYNMWYRVTHDWITGA